MAVTTARTKIGRLRVIQEPTTFGADVSTSVGSMGDLCLTDAFMPVIDPEMLVDGRIVQNIHDHPADVVGFKKADGLQAKGYLKTSGQTLNAAATPSQLTLEKQLQRIVGGYQGNAGTAYASGASATGCTVTAAQGSRIPAGTLVAIESANASSLFAVRKILSQATDAVTWSIATGLGNTPFTIATGARILNSLLIYPTNNPNTSGLHLAFLAESEDRYQTWWFTGAQASALTIEWPLGKDIMWGATFMSALRWRDDQVNTPLGTGGAIATASYDDGARAVATAGNIWFTPFAGTVLAAPAVYDFTFNPGTKWQSDDAFNGVEGRTGYSYLPDQATATITVGSDPSANTVRTYEQARDAGTLYQLLAQAGQTAGGIVALELPRVQITSVKVIDKNGLRRIQLGLKCLQDTAGSTELATAPWRLGRL